MLTHAHARRPPIYPFSFLLVSPRAASCPASLPLFLHTLNCLSGVGPSSYRRRRAVLSFFPSLPFVAICKAKNDKRRSTADRFETSWEDQRGHRSPLARIPLNGLSLASPFSNRSMELVSSPRLDVSLYFAFAFLSSFSPFALLRLSSRRRRRCRPPPARFFFTPVAISLSPLSYLTTFVSTENFIIRRVTLTEA